MELLMQLLREYSAASAEDRPALLEDINAMTAGMDEGALTEYIALLMQIQSLLDSGMTEAEVQALRCTCSLITPALVVYQNHD